MFEVICLSRGLLYNVLAAKYGEEDRWTKAGGSKTYGWWKDLCGIKDRVGGH